MTGSGCTRRRDGLVVQVAALGPGDHDDVSVRVDGHAWSVPVTNRARTVADSLRHLELADGVPLGDSALRQGRVTYEQVAHVLARQETWPWAARGRRALALLDVRHESWLESYSFCVLHLAGLPRPEPQVTVCDRGGRFVARVDGWLDDCAVALEPDGRGKYLADLGVLSADVESAAEQVAAGVRARLLAQNERERRLRALGIQVVRWGTREIVHHPAQVLARVAAARRAGDRTTLTGHVRSLPAPPWRAQAERAS